MDIINPDFQKRGVVNGTYANQFFKFNLGICLGLSIYVPSNDVCEIILKMFLAQRRDLYINLFLKSPLQLELWGTWLGLLVVVVVFTFHFHSLILSHKLEEF